MHISIDKKKKSVKNLTFQSNTWFSVDTKTNMAAGRIDKGACNVVADIAVSLKNHGVFFCVTFI